MSNLTRYAPNRNALQKQRVGRPLLMDQHLDSAWWDPFSVPSLDPLNVFRSWGFGSPGEFFPGDNLAIDLYEEDDRLVVKASLPGVQEDAIEVVEENGFLTIRARNEANIQQERSGLRIQELRHRVWQRSLRLPMEVDVHRAEAVLKNGVLTIQLPKREPLKNVIQRIKLNLPKIKLPGQNGQSGKIKISHNG